MSGPLAVAPAPAAPAPIALARPARSRFVPIALAIVTVWLAILYASLYAPSLVAGSDHETIAVAALADWLWGGLATAFLLLAAAFSRPEGGGAWWVAAVVTTAVWIVVGLASVHAPSFVTGTDPTTIPVAGLLAPIVGVLVTGYVSVFAAGMSGQRGD